jgi:nucleoside-diphosphate-sugar epimerase
MTKIKRHIVITGGAGYIGSMLVPALLARGDWVTVIDKLLFGGGSLVGYLSSPTFHFVRGDVCESGIFERAVQESKAKGAPEPSAVIHLAAIVGFPACKIAGKDAAWNTNVKSVEQVFQAANQMNVERFILSSTYSVYGVAEDGAPVTEDSQLHPQSLYGESKIAAEEFLVKAADMAACAPMIYRFSTLYGLSPRMRFDLIINQFSLEAYLQGELMIFEGHHSRAFVHIRDVIAGLLIGLDAPEEKIRGQIFNLGHEGGNFTKDEIADLICQVLPDTKVRHERMSFDGDMRNLQVSFEKIESVLNFQTRYSVLDGIQEVTQALRDEIINEPTSPIYRNAPSIVP